MEDNMEEHVWFVSYAFWDELLKRGYITRV